MNTNKSVSPKEKEGIFKADEKQQFTAETIVKRYIMLKEKENLSDKEQKEFKFLSKFVNIHFNHPKCQGWIKYDGKMLFVLQTIVEYNNNTIDVDYLDIKLNHFELKIKRQNITVPLLEFVKKAETHSEVRIKRELVPSGSFDYFESL
jgi:hypothetical protein